MNREGTAVEKEKPFKGLLSCLGFLFPKQTAVDLITPGNWRIDWYDFQ